MDQRLYGAPVWGGTYFRYLLYRFRFTVFVEDNTASAAAAAGGWRLGKLFYRLGYFSYY